ncbi:MAG: Fic family protein [Candidatus Woesearchaeota archaeon]
MRSLENIIQEIYENRKKINNEINEYYLNCQKMINGYIENDTLTHFLKENYPYAASQKLNESIKNSYEIENIDLNEEELKNEREKMLDISKKLHREFNEDGQDIKVSRLLSILSKVEKESVLRSGPVLINEGDYIPPESQSEIESELDKFQYQIINDEKMEPVEKALHYHYQFVRIHPFRDGNGRSARLLSNTYLFAKDFFPAVINRGERMNYARLLDKACYSRKGNYDILKNLTSEEETLFTYLASKINNEYYLFRAESRLNKC